MTETETDTVTLSFPRKSQYYAVARLVVGGMAAPLNMSYDALDDLQQAISHLLDSEDLPVAGDLTLQLDVGEDSMAASIGGFQLDSVDAAFERSEQTAGGEFGLRRILDTFVDSVEVDRRDTGEWVTLTKRVKATV